MTRRQNRPFTGRRFDCPKCGTEITIPRLWIVGVESVFLCPECRLKFKTGYKVGAVLFALSLTAAVVTANLGAWVFSSITIPLWTILIIPLWIFYGFVLRRWWLLLKAKRESSRQSDDS